MMQTITQSHLYVYICCKLMEHILCHSITKHLELRLHHMLNNFHYGFRTGHSCQAQLITLIEEIQFALDHHDHVYLIMLDFCKALTVAHNYLLNKMKLYDIQEKIYD